MERATRSKGRLGGSPAARTGAKPGLWARSELCCLGCGYALVAAVAPAECPTCHGSVWEYRPPDSDHTPRRAEAPSAPFANVARWVIGSDRARGWRFEQLQRAGYPARDALVLSACSGVDLHQAIRLLRNGCPHPTAMRILV
jgi:hypothetical protein